ncbi:MAG: hypothetical protein MI673_09500 [Thiotrichales bacterium]|nr:hypothetical protein [Thiotrichales bacterium]
MFFRGFLLLIAGLLLASCARLDPDIIQAGSSDYNVAMQSSRDEQMLLNLIRLKYHDTPYFLEASSVSSQFRLTSQATASANFASRPVRDTVGLSGNISFVEQPTVTYTPLHGNDFVQRLLIPVSLDTILLLVNSGWSVERVLRLTVEKINGIPNGPSASGPTPNEVPEFELFLSIVSILEELRKLDQLHFGYKQNEQEAQAVVNFADSIEQPHLIDNLKQLLDLNSENNQFNLVEGKTEKNPRDTIVITTRSLLGVLFYLSHSVKVPESDKQRGIVTRTYYDDGSEFDWNLLTKRLFTVKSVSSVGSEPVGTIRTSYRGHAFYIADNDLDSKSTFSLLSQLFSLQAGNTEGIKPVLTIPIGQ